MTKETKKSPLKVVEKKLYKTSELINYQNLLGLCARSFDGKNTDPELYFVVAKNIKNLKNALKTFYEDNEIRVDSFCSKTADGKNKTIDGEFNTETMKVDKMWDFGDNLEKAEAKYQELLNVKIEFEFVTIKTNTATKKIPPLIQAELLDVMIID